MKVVRFSLTLPMPASLKAFASEDEVYFSREYSQWIDAQDWPSIRKRLRKKIEASGCSAAGDWLRHPLLPVEIMLVHPEFIELSATGKKPTT